MNNYEFWEKYLDELHKALKKLCQSKKELYIDLHIHSTYSQDGKQSIKEILDTTKSKGFDIIAITDHDTLNAYDEIFNYVKDGLTNPIIIPGIEFTVDNREYGNQCHLLQLFVNPKDDTILDDVLTNYNAAFNRSKLQFKRLNENLAIKEVLKKKKFKISYNEYIKYLNDNGLYCEYDTLCFYLIDKFKKNGVTTFDILELLEKYNEMDIYEDRKAYKTKRFKKLREKYEFNHINKYNARFLLSMLAVREVDDDWWPKPSSGSLSVNSYGQLKVEDINQKYSIYFAHPTEKSLKVVEKIINNKKNIFGLELNIRNDYEDITRFYDLLDKYGLIKSIGSDSHDATLTFYQDMDFYKMLSKDFLKIVDRK